MDTYCSLNDGGVKILDMPPLCFDVSFHGNGSQVPEAYAVIFHKQTYLKYYNNAWLA